VFWSGGFAEQYKPDTAQTLDTTTANYVYTGGQYPKNWGGYYTVIHTRTRTSTHAPVRVSPANLHAVLPRCRCARPHTYTLRFTNANAPRSAGEHLQRRLNAVQRQFSCFKHLFGSDPLLQG